MDDDLPWEKLFERADRVVKATIASLPEAVRAEARRVPCILEKWPPEGTDFLGLCASFEPDMVSGAPGPIFLYVGAIHLECLDYDLDFGDEVRVTYLHELGHHLGLDEEDLDDRGLA